jgi:hypothetical protein
MERFGPCAEPRICPLCGGKLLSQDIPPGKFNCKHCVKELQPRFFRGYVWVRGLCCCAVGGTAAWHAGYGGSFIVFVIGVYALPVLIAWDLIVNKYLLPKQLEAVPPYVPSIISDYRSGNHRQDAVRHLG